MNIYITLDYELYFGEKSGTIEKSIIEPTEELINIADKHGVKFVFFVDVGYLLKLEEYKNKYSILEKDFELLTGQLNELAANGHELQLHIHPHWEDSYFKANEWQINTSRYKLHDFTSKEISDIIKRYKEKLEGVSKNTIFAYRAGGWSIQPFKKILEGLKANDIWLDSTVFKGGISKSEHQYFDFKKCPDKTDWKFETDPLQEQPDGFFTELPISSIHVSPWFYWKLAAFKIFNKKGSEEIGDGKPIYPPLWEKLKKLTFPTYSPVSIDGYKASLLQKAKTQYRERYGDQSNFIIMGHPKATTKFSLQNLDQFLGNLSKNDQVVTFSGIFNDKIF